MGKIKQIPNDVPWATHTLYSTVATLNHVTCSPVSLVTDSVCPRLVCLVDIS